MNLRELVDTVDVPETRVAEDAWEIASRRTTHRRTVAAVVLAGIAVVIVLVSVNALMPRTTLLPATPTTRSPQPSPTTSADAGEQHLPVTITRPDWDALGTGLGLEPGDDAPPLSSDPVKTAALVMGDSEDQAVGYVLGDDGEWRTLDVPGLTPVADGRDRLYTSSIIRPAGLSPDGERLAIPQMDELVVVDLTTGSAQRFDVPGPQHDVSWLDTFNVLVSLESAVTATIVDTDSGEVSESELAPETRGLSDGSLLSWPRSPGSTYTWNGAALQSVVNNRGAYQGTVPLADEGIGVVISGGGPIQDPPPEYPPQGVNENVGIAAVDLASGDPVGYLTIASSMDTKGTLSVLLGWRGEDPVVGLVPETMVDSTLFVAAWDIDAGTLDPMATLPDENVSWGTGLWLGRVPESAQ